MGSLDMVLFKLLRTGALTCDTEVWTWRNPRQLEEESSCELLERYDVIFAETYEDLSSSKVHHINNRFLSSGVGESCDWHVVAWHHW